MRFDEGLEIVEDNPARQPPLTELFTIDTFHQLRARVVRHAIGTAVLVRKHAIHRHIVILVVLLPAHLETPLDIRRMTQEIPQQLVRQGGAEEVAQSRAKRLGLRARQRRLFIHRVQDPRRVRHDRDPLILQRTPRLRRKRRAVEPHLLGHQPPVVRQDALVHIHEVL